MKEASVFLGHIIESIEWIEREIAGMTLQEFRSSVLTQDAVMRRLEIIGEATKHLPLGLKREYREIPWDDIAGMRDVLIHEYFGVNIGTVWTTVKRNLPPLRSAVLVMFRLEPA